jgi:hypothetical protein
VVAKNGDSVEDVMAEDGETRIPVHHAGRITFVHDEFRFFLHRHWKLYNSMK